MYNRYALRAKWRKHPLRVLRRASARTENTVREPTKVSVAKRSDDLPLSVPQYLVIHLHLSRCWKQQLIQELDWFLATLRGDMEPYSQVWEGKSLLCKPAKNYTIHHVHLPQKQYFVALEALTTKLGVKLTREA